MRTTDRAKTRALALIAATAATVAAGIAALARAGVALCDHRVLVHHHDGAMAMGGAAMAGTPVAAAPAADGVCSILFYAAALAASLCVLAVLVLVGRPVAVALAAAFRLLVPGADAPWFAAHRPLLVPAGVRLARRRPSRAPPVLR